MRVNHVISLMLLKLPYKVTLATLQRIVIHHIIALMEMCAT